MLISNHIIIIIMTPNPCLAVSRKVGVIEDSCTFADFWFIHHQLVYSISFNLWFRCAVSRAISTHMPYRSIRQSFSTFGPGTPLGQPGVQTVCYVSERPFPKRPLPKTAVSRPIKNLPFHQILSLVDSRPFLEAAFLRTTFLG